MRPRGESISSPHRAYVGQVGRQNPQCTQSEISSSDGGWCRPKTPASFPVVSDGPTSTRWSSWRLVSVMTSRGPLGEQGAGATCRAGPGRSDPGGRVDGAGTAATRPTTEPGRGDRF